MSQADIESYSDYLDHLQLHPDEFTALFNAILINVTGFFRDPEAWDHLRAEVLPSIVAGTGPIRIWSAACASGQEAYTLAIAFAEELGFEEFRRRVKIYATDVDEDGLSHARQASYSEREIAGLSPEHIDRYFEPTGSRHAFRSDLRRSVIFGRNDLIQDAPISRVDLLVCRNTLMYFNAETQSRILARLHFALADRGVLFSATPSCCSATATCSRRWT
jgi:two-component system, chemotaxis family, CheB/CheR fusion protein